MQPMKVRKVIEVEVRGLGGMIKKARGDKTIVEAARTAKISRQAWYDIEAEKVVLKAETLDRIQSALGVDFNVKF